MVAAMILYITVKRAIKGSVFYNAFLPEVAPQPAGRRLGLGRRRDMWVHWYPWA